MVRDDRLLSVVGSYGKQAGKTYHYSASSCAWHDAKYADCLTVRLLSTQQVRWSTLFCLQVNATKPLANCTKYELLQDSLLATQYQAPTHTRTVTIRTLRSLLACVALTESLSRQPRSRSQLAQSYAGFSQSLDTAT